MKKITPGLVCFLLLITSCDMPETITIKGNPELYFPLGSPFAGLKDGERLEDSISPKKIKEMISDTEGTEVYEASRDMAAGYGIDENVLTYLVKYPIDDLLPVLPQTMEMRQDIGPIQKIYPIGNNGDFMGGEVSFDNVKGYVSISGLECNGPINMTVTINGSPQKRELNKPDKEPEKTLIDTKPDGTEIVNINLRDSCFKDDTTPLNLTPLFKSGGANLQVDISIKGLELHRGGNYKKDVKFSLFLLIPLDLKVSGEIADPNVPQDIKAKYVKLDLGESFKDNLWDGDLFGREPEEENNLGIEYMKIGIKKTNINLIDKPGRFAVLATTTENNPENSPLMVLEDNQYLKISSGSPDALLYSPKLYILLEKDKNNNGTYETFGSFKILRQEKLSFDINLYVEVKTALKYTF
jgi:hypothetical protein